MNSLPTRVIGHGSTQLLTGAANLVEGRELNLPQDVAVDTLNQIIYVADTGNHRVMAWRNATSVITGQAADFVVGQNDIRSTFIGGPGTALNSGLFGPTALAVDSSGNLYVADAGNNRIVRYNRPFAQPAGEPILADFVMGQTSVSSGRSPNAGGRTAKSLFFSSGSGLLATALRFDNAGNLWVADAGNGRVLRFPASVLEPNRPNNPEADLVLGQAGFTQFQGPQNASTKLTLSEPAALAFDPTGRLYVADGLNRVLVYAPPFSSGMAAQRIMGAPKPVGTGQPPLPPVNEYTVGAVANNNVLPPTGLFVIGNTPFVVDQAANRILRFPVFEQWPAESESVSPAAAAVIGQDSFQQTEVKVNRGLPEPGRNGFNSPSKATFADGRVYVADTFNNRLLIFPSLANGPATTSGSDYSATAVLGQTDFIYRAPNLAEGREFANPNGIAVFTTANGTPRMYIADTGNNRVLGFADARRVKPGDKADLVIGQSDFSRVLINSPTNKQEERTASSLYSPTAVAVDRDGNLFVADGLNHRVLRFSDPFAPGFNGAANLVLGQSSFTAGVVDASSRTLGVPSGLAFSGEGLLLVSDELHNRVMVFQPPFTNGMAAVKVIGQPNFTSITPGTSADNDRLNRPRGVGVDTDDRVYVADFSTNRIMVFGRVSQLSDSPATVFTINTSQPVGIAVSKLTGEVWTLVGTGTRRYPKFDSLFSNGDAFDFEFGAENNSGQISNRFLAAAFDNFNNLYFTEAANRVSVYYPRMAACSGASFAPATLTQSNSTASALAPGMIATLSTTPGRGCEGNEDFVFIFTDKERSAASLPNPIPLPTVMEDLQVTFNGEPAPLYYVSNFQINFQVPFNAPTSGTADVLVTQVSTGRVIAAVRVRMTANSPGVFTLSFERGTPNAPVTQLARRQAAVLNQDGKINSKDNPAERNSIIQIFGTGIGPIPNAPTAGTLAPNDRLLRTTANVRVGIGTSVVDPGDNGVTFAGLAPGSVGLWQVNVKVPDTVPPGDAALGLFVNDAISRTREYGYLTIVWIK